MGLRRMRALLDQLGSPDRRLRIIHIAGSKGKGSTAAFAAAIGQAAGYRVGLSTSPHLHSYRERIAIHGSPVTHAQFARFAAAVHDETDQLERSRPELGQVTAFEILTAMALLAFEQESCDLAVVEVGLGGTFDATNVVDPVVSVITRLDLEHTQVLGDSIESIAANKAGIIKRHTPVVTAAQEAAALAVIRATAEQRHAPLQIAVVDFAWEGSWRDFAWRGASLELTQLHAGLAGAHQMENASLAIAAWGVLRKAGFDLEESAIRMGVEATHLPGRFERVEREGHTWVLDGAHTPVAAAALADELLAEFGQPVTGIVALLRDKQADQFVQALAPAISELIVTTTANPRSIPADELAHIASTVLSQTIPSPGIDTAFQRIRAASPGPEVVVITGSLSLVAEARTRLGLANPDDDSPNPGICG
ncbi:MAG: bifunctional folylpolyglutamate synthase/dihydrofolate synthase [Thermomicrobiales bacterium]|nr:bifunctional folylpolyglutamate synthase/dihydrofolate synthase [Thermomicrobiales bacterium]